MNRATLLSLAACVAASFALLPSCSSGGGDDDSSAPAMDSYSETRTEVLTKLADDVIVPAYRDFLERAEELRDALAALRSSPDASSLDDAQAAWRAARRAWNRCEAFLIGPPEDRLLDAKIDTAPVNESLIEFRMSSGETMDSAFIESVGSTQKGFFAIEYLIFDRLGGGDSAILDSLTTAAGADPRREYVAALGENLADLADEILDAWLPAGGDLAGEFSRGLPEIEERLLDDIVNRMVIVAETIADQRLGRPLGRTSGGLAQEPGTEAQRSGNSRVDILDDLRGFRGLYLGTFGGGRETGLSDLVQVVSADIDAAIRAALTAARADVDAIPETLLETATSDREMVQTAFDSIRELKNRVAVDLVSALSVTLRFSPFDGD